MATAAAVSVNVLVSVMASSRRRTRPERRIDRPYHAATTPVMTPAFVEMRGAVARNTRRPTRRAAETRVLTAFRVDAASDGTKSRGAARQARVSQVETRRTNTRCA
jgi:hypothetical protein